ncbi:exported hypothetical protein [Thiocapsa sp. KS1]|nr:hypothetical protein [Thiocapsa sp. KS1]CRI67255.1 exported hypothetical protein [Thiocapsa sp. KS1]
MKIVASMMLLCLCITPVVSSAKCFSEPNQNAQCRFAEGDAWCLEKFPDKPYAYRDSCLNAESSEKSAVEALGPVVSGSRNSSEEMQAADVTQAAGNVVEYYSPDKTALDTATNYMMQNGDNTDNNLRFNETGAVEKDSFNQNSGSSEQLAEEKGNQSEPPGAAQSGDDLMVFVVLVSGVLGGVIARKKKRSLVLHIILSLIFPFIWPLLLLAFRNKNNRCTWCNSPSLKFVDGHVGEWVWEYRNKGGERDKRVKDNYQIAAYYSTWSCNKCGAISSFAHYMSRNPSKRSAVSGGHLVESGSGKRKGSDFEKKGTIVDSQKANRKNAN